MPERRKYPWDRQKGESRQAFEAFREYRDMGDTRRLVAVGEKLGKSEALMERWSFKWGWVDRVAAYEESVRAEAEHRLFERRVDEQLAAAEENDKQQRLRVQEARRLAQTADGGLAVAAPVALARLRAAQAEVKALIEGGGSADKIKAAIGDAVQVLNWATKSLDVAHKLEALALGKATDRTMVQLDPASIDRLAAIITARLPEDEWESVVDEVAAVLKGEGVNGNA